MPPPTMDKLTLQAAFLKISHALLVLGLSLINYGALTPSFEGMGIALLGSMLAFTTMCVLGISLIRYVLLLVSLIFIAAPFFPFPAAGIDHLFAGEQLLNFLDRARAIMDAKRLNNQG
jgi:hypothetical protein